MRILLILIFCGWLSLSGNAQVGGFLKERLDKGKAALKEKANAKGEEKLDAERDRIDSTDFNYAISVIDNSGMMNVRDFDETATKAAYFVLKNNENKTAAQKARDLLSTAQTLFSRRSFKAAEYYFLAAQVSYESEGITNNINYSKVFSDLGLLYSALGRYNTASQFTEQALEIRQQTLGENSFGYAASINNRAVLYQELAFYNEAEKDFQEAKTIAKNVVGANSQEYAIVLNNEAILLAEVGRYDEAIANLKQAVAVLESAKKATLRNQVGFQSNLALLYQKTNRFNEAETIYLGLEKKLDKGINADKVFHAGILNNLALLYVQMNKPDQVEGLLKRAAEDYKSKLGEDSPNYAKVLADQGWFYRINKRYTEAEPLLVKSLEIREKTLGPNHPDYARGREELAILYWKTQQWDKAYGHYKVVMDKTIDFINQYFPPMSESEKTKFWDITYPRFQRYNNFAIEAKAALPTIVQDMYDYQTATKALLLNSTSKVKNAILRSGNAALVKDYLTWLDQKESLARYYSLSKQDIRDQKINLDSIEQAANRMEKSLSERSKEFSTGYTTQKVNYKEIRNLLTDQEAVVEIIRVKNYDQDFTSESKYAALVLTKAMEQPQLVILENGAQLDTRYAKFYRNAIQQKVADEYAYVQYWERIEKSLQGKKFVYLSPDGVYNQINPYTFKSATGGYLLSQYDLIIVGNSKDLIALKSRKPGAGRKDGFLLGFPDYGGTSVAPLPGTKVELEAVSKILKVSGYQLKQVMQKEATETMFKTVKGPALMHIATHGFFLQDADVKSGASVGVSLENAQENPLLRSGLLLSGAAVTMSGNANVNLSSNDNGVLTAYEAMNLNLDGTDLIVMSACETGLGDVKAGEGVYGLQRAFQVAGANALIMSLWKVDDDATQQLMTNFYTNWVKSGNKQKAFKLAQQQLMVKYKDPYYWGAFVMMGM
jgi:CHAT domain-containing protein